SRRRMAAARESMSCPRSAARNLPPRKSAGRPLPARCSASSSWRKENRMTWLRRFANLFRRGRLNDEIAEELAAHLEEAMERGRSPQADRRAFGAPLQHREHSREVQLLPWLDALESDVVFGGRQRNKHRVVSADAIIA